jgi:cyclopropane fatty-acyl-phospholipid synthase-like methyltransferase
MSRRPSMTGARRPRSRSPEERELSEHFANEYRQAQAPVILDLERAVCGCDYGGTSWTTRDEAERMSSLMELAEGSRLLEIGAGSGWPALYLAGLSNCHATLADLPHEALRIAADRVAGESLHGEIFMTVADGACLPFKRGYFDAISHSDVLCCLAPKRETLDECRRVIRDDGKMAFTVISVSPGLSCAHHARAVDCGPPFVEAECDYTQLLESTGWNVIDRIDVTTAYGRTGALYIREVEARADEMRDLLGEAEFDELLAKRKRNVQAAEDEIVLRHMFLASPL